MSVQLILYPQNYQGQFNTITIPYFVEFVSDYSFNIGTLGTGFSGSMISLQDFFASGLLTAPTNVWQQYNSTGVVGVADPATITNGKVIIDCANSGTASLSGIYQLISNLSIGATYELKVQRLAGTTGLSTIGHNAPITIGGTTYHPILNQGLPASVGTHTFQFTATHFDQLLLINYINNDNSNLEIGEVSIKKITGAIPTTAVFKDGQVICDLYDESNLPLSLAIDDFKNVHEKKQSFSAPFKLPATKRNNKIFTSLFDVTKSVQSDAYSFNPYRKTKCILKEDGYIIFDGHLRLIDIINKEGEISYNVNLYSETITLSETLKEKKFKHIDFSELDHDYNKTNIKASHFDTDGVTLTNFLSTDSFAYKASLGTGKTDVIKYPFCKWNGESYNTINLSTLDPYIHLPRLEDAFRPFINCKYLLDKIMHDAGFTFNSDFLESNDFTRLFMDFNWGAGVSPLLFNDTMKISTSSSTVAAGFNNIAYDTGQIPPHYDTSTKVFTADQDNLTFSGQFSVVLNHTGGADEVVKLRWIHKDSSGTEIDSEIATFTITDSTYPVLKQKSLDVTLNNTDTLELQIFSASSASNIEILNTYVFPVQFNITYRSKAVIETSSDVSFLDALMINRGELGQWDFVSGLFKMFNLMALQDKDNPSNLIIEPYTDVFITGNSQYITHKTHDWTDKTDASEMKLTPLKLQKKIEFNFVKEEKDYATQLYETTTGYKYGSRINDASIYNLLEGETKIELPFASTFIKPIFENWDEMIIPVIYTEKESGEFEGFENKPRILYNVGRYTMASPYKYRFPSQAGESLEYHDSFGQFSHFSEIPTTSNTKDYNFETQQILTSVGSVVPVDNLYNTYWAPYYDELYNPDTRQVNLKVYLTPSEIANFNFYDKVRIKNRLFRVNKIEYKPYELSSVELILIG
ncbi:MAG: hypothetical protein GOVbin2669_42 [Prokaryotic dsDNA virus sp.]|nr:MAG: hypothetical protein GOVbin2669_42 [Prokaryotic dsDNA virus sp.]|tara:strand:+ start:1769 stop:4528 length:2760 start_codon:yes stop_codon:yes gene_type:complete